MAKRSQRQATKSDILSAVRRVAEADTTSFVELVALAGLSPKDDFVDANLSDMDFSNADLRGFNFRGAIFHRSDLRGANLSGTGFDPTNAQGALTEEAIIDGEELNAALSVERLSVEGEIAINKRMEAGRDMIVHAVIASVGVKRQIIGWYNALGNREIAVTDLVDLHSFVSGPRNLRAGPASQTTRSKRKTSRPIIPRKFLGGFEVVLSQEIRERLTPYILDQFELLIDRLEKVPSDPRIKYPREPYTTRQIKQSDAEYQKWRHSVSEIFRNIALTDVCLEDLCEILASDGHRLKAIEAAINDLGPDPAIADFMERYLQDSSRAISEELAYFVGIPDLVVASSRVGRDKLFHRLSELCQEISGILMRSRLSRSDFFQALNSASKGKRELLRAKNEMVEANLWLVAEVAAEFETADQKGNEAASLGRKGLLEAVDTFHYRDKRRFADHAIPIIRTKIQNVVRARL